MSHKYAKRRAEYALCVAENLRKELARKEETVRTLDHITAELLTKHETLFVMRDCERDCIAVRFEISKKFWHYVRAHGHAVLEQHSRAIVHALEVEFTKQGLLP